MKVFISWSGERSKRVAELLDEWIQCVIQAVDPWMSSKDIDRGSLWFTEINSQLSNTTVGIVCLTNENKDKPWILFEAGALAKGLSSNRVCTFLIDLKSTDLQDPLAQFNHTFSDKNSIWELLLSINRTLDSDALKISILEKVFETYWPQFESTFKTILKETHTDTNEKKVKRKESDVLNDVLSTVRNLDKRMRGLEAANNNSSYEVTESSNKYKYELNFQITSRLSANTIVDALSEYCNINDFLIEKRGSSFSENRNEIVSHILIKSNRFVTHNEISIALKNAGITNYSVSYLKLQA